MRGARTDRRGEVHLAGREADLARLPAININRRVGIQVLHIQGDAPAGPVLGDGDRAFVPSALDLAEIRVLPARVRGRASGSRSACSPGCRASRRAPCSNPSPRWAPARALSAAGCQRHSPLMQRRSRVGVVSRLALAKSHTALTPGGNVAPDGSCAAVEQASARIPHAAAGSRTEGSFFEGPCDGW